MQVPVFLLIYFHFILLLLQRSLINGVSKSVLKSEWKLLRFNLDCLSDTNTNGFSRKTSANMTFFLMWTAFTGKTFLFDCSVNKGVSIFNPFWLHATYFQDRTNIGLERTSERRVCHSHQRTSYPLEIKCVLFVQIRFTISIFIKLFLLTAPNLEALNSEDKHRLLYWYRKILNTPAHFPPRQLNSHPGPRSWAHICRVMRKQLRSWLNVDASKIRHPFAHHLI